MSGRLVFIYRKIGSAILSHAGVRLVPKLVTLNDLERRNGRYFALSQLNSVALGSANNVKVPKVVDVRPILSAIKILHD